MPYKTDKEIENLMAENPLFRSAGFYPFRQNVLEFILSQRRQDREAIREWADKKAYEIYNPLRKRVIELTDLLSFLDWLEK